MKHIDVSPAAVEQRLLDLDRELDEAQADLARRDEQVARAKHGYEIAFARALLSAKDGRNAGEREALATLATEGPALELRLAESLLRTARERCGAIRAHLDVARTLSASLRAEWQGRVA